MKFSFIKSLLLSAALAWMPLTASAANERGFFGFHVNVETDGPVPPEGSYTIYAPNSVIPTVRNITIDRIFADSPAAKSGIGVGDQIIEIDGITVAGRNAIDLEPVTRKTVGRRLRLKLKRKNGELYTADLVAIPRPAYLQ
jgi:S1-C subfamily serine protease